MESATRADLEGMLFQIEQAFGDHGKWYETIARSVICRSPFDPRETSPQVALEAQRPWHGVPILAFSARVSLEERSACKTAGMTDFLCKPIERKQLSELLKKHTPERPAGPQSGLPEIADLDQEHLEEVCAGDVEFEKELTGTYMMELEQVLGDLERARIGQDPPRFRRAAHSLKSASRYVGTTRLCKLTEQLEKLVVNGDLDGAELLVPALIEASYSARVALDTFSRRSR